VLLCRAACAAQNARRIPRHRDVKRWYACAHDYRHASNIVSHHETLSPDAPSKIRYRAAADIIKHRAARASCRATRADRQPARARAEFRFSVFSKQPCLSPNVRRAHPRAAERAHRNALRGPAPIRRLTLNETSSYHLPPPARRRASPRQTCAIDECVANIRPQMTARG